MPRPHPSYPAEYRRKIVALARAGRTLQSLAQEYEPCANTIANWVKQSDLDEGVRDDGWKMANHLRTELVLDALDMAVRQRQPVGVIHHSDKGCQYTSLAFGHRCRAVGVRPSTGSVGDSYDNAMCESFFATLKHELTRRHTFKTKAQAEMVHLRVHRRLLQPASTALRPRLPVTDQVRTGCPGGH